MYTYDVPPPTLCSSELVDYSRTGQLQLRSVMLNNIRGTDNELFLMKTLLACSPLLKKMVIFVNSSQFFDGARGCLMFATKLLKLHRASPIAEIDTHWM